MILFNIFLQIPSNPNALNWELIISTLSVVVAVWMKAQEFRLRFDEQDKLIKRAVDDLQDVIDDLKREIQNTGCKYLPDNQRFKSRQTDYEEK